VKRGVAVSSFDDVIEIIERIRAEDEARRIQYEKLATIICGRKISVAFASDCGSALCGGEAIGSSDRSSIVILNYLGRVTEHCVFFHELVHAYLEHSSRNGGDHTGNKEELLNLLPLAARESVRAEINAKEIDANRLGRKLHEAFFPDETWEL
jgi:hypothetical protein